jgi:cell division protein FtsX
MTALPGYNLFATKRSRDETAYRRVIVVFIRNGTPSAAVAAMTRQIVAMPEIEAYHFATKREALAALRRQLGADANLILKNMKGNPLPASFQLLVRDRAEIADVARRFCDNPIVDNDPGTRNGVCVPSQVDDLQRLLHVGSGSP